GSAETRDPDPLYLTAEGARRGHRAQPPRASRWYHPAGAAPRCSLPGADDRDPDRRHAVARARAVPAAARGYLHHDPGVALPRAHEPRPRGSAPRRTGDRRRDQSGRPLHEGIASSHDIRTYSGAAATRRADVVT